MSSRFFRGRVSHFTSLLLYASFLWVAISNHAVAQQQPQRAHPLRYVPRLVPLSRAAGTIFSGTVTSVRRMAAKQSGEVETVQVSFRVEHAIRGTQAGQHLTIREWSGLWSSGERYRVGERVLLFLYPPSKLGLTSPVGGPQGRFVVDKHGQVTIGNWPAGVNRNDEPAAPFGEEGPAKSRVSLRDLAQAVRQLQEER